jgi:Lrp/AsnC family transcriptional regulator for asnA, asnC and gidA
MRIKKLKPSVKETASANAGPATVRNKRSKLTDEQIVSMIGDNARLSAEKLARKLKVSPTTVRRHLKAATRKGIIHTVAVVDPDKVGLTLQAVLGFNVSRDSLDSIMDKLEKESEIKWLVAVTGEYDIMARAAFTSIDELSAFLRDKLSNIKGINNTESFICLNIPKGRFISLD